MEDRSPLCNITPEQLAYLATTFAAVLAKEFSKDEVIVLSSFFSNVGSTLGLIALQHNFLQDSGKPVQAAELSSTDIQGL